MCFISQKRVQRYKEKLRIKNEELRKALFFAFFNRSDEIIIKKTRRESFLRIKCVLLYVEH